MGAGIHGGFGNTHGAAVPGDAIYKSEPKLYFDYIKNRRDIDCNGVYDVVAHGKDAIIQIEHNGQTIDIDSRTASKLFSRRSDYKRGQSIRLLSCDTGASATGFAQNLANKLNVVVKAPTKLVWAYPDGKYIVASRNPKNPNTPNLKDLGKFVKFYPGGRENERKR